MGLSIGIVGLPNVGKSTLFNALTRQAVLCANYPFATIEANVGVVELPDARLAKLAEMHHSERVVPAPVTFVDIAGIVKGASEGEGLGNKFLAAIRESDAICQVVRAFTDPDVIHVNGAVAPKSDIATVNTELILADLQTMENRISKLQREVRRDAKLQVTLDGLQKAQDILNVGTTLSSAAKSGDFDLDVVADLHLLTAKEIIYVFNVDEAQITDRARAKELGTIVAPTESLVVCAQIEAELAGLDPSDADELLSGYGLTEPGLDRLAHAGFRTLGLQTYLTSGEKESRAWTIHIGDTAPQAAGVIHTDFQKGFIKAEVVSYDDLIAAGSIAAARSFGKVRMEGRDYIMRDGDVVEFRFNV